MRQIKDLSHRDASGNWISRYSGSLSSQKIGVSLFNDDHASIRAIAEKIDATPTEIVREIVRLWLADAKTDAFKILNKALPPESS
jgi:IS30 family transposase